MLIAVINGSTKLSDAQVSVMTRAVSHQMHNDYAKAWEATSPGVVFFPHPADVPPRAFRMLIADDADAAGALGYHDQDPEGKPYGKVFVNVTEEAGEQPSGVLSHEVLEMAGDPECNLWAQRDDGILVCRELGDPVQASGYEVTVVTGRHREDVWVSNFVLPAWFDYAPQKGARFDFLGVLRAPFSLDPGGYYIWTDGRKYGNVFGSTEGLDRLRPRAADKLHPAARTRRRYDRLEQLAQEPELHPAVLGLGTTWS